MQRETLTPERIKKDIVRRMIYDEVLPTLLSMLVCSGTIAVIVLACKLMLNKELNLPSIVIALIALLNLFFLTKMFVNIAQVIKGIKNSSICISSAKLTDRVEGGYHRRGLPNAPYVCYELCFYPYNNYSIPARKHYKWSKEHSMSEKDLFKTSEIGDEFVLVTQSKKDILLVYNTKFFEYKP